MGDLSEVTPGDASPSQLADPPAPEISRDGEPDRYTAPAIDLKKALRQLADGIC